MEHNEFGSYEHGFNYPRPMFVFCGPGYVRVHDPDEMMESLNDGRERWENMLANLRLYLKLPGAPELIRTWPRFPKDVDEGMVEFEDLANLATGALTGVKIFASWSDEEFDEDEVTSE